MQTRPQRPRFSWDGRSVLWTDGVRDQFEYAEGVSAWGAFDDNLSGNNSN